MYHENEGKRQKTHTIYNLFNIPMLAIAQTLATTSIIVIILLLVVVLLVQVPPTNLPDHVPGYKRIPEKHF